MKINTIISWSLKIALILLFLFFIYEKKYQYALGSLISILIFLTPFILKKKYDVYLPWIFDLLIVLPLFLFIFGSFLGLYKYETYSIVTHFIGTIIIALLAFSLAFTLNITNQLRLTIKQIMLFTIVFSMAIGVLWEIGEFISDTNFNTQVQRSNKDTMLDLIFDTISGIVTSIIGALYIKYAPQHKVNKNIVDPFATMLKIRKRY